MAKPSEFVYRLADGSVESSDGDVGVTMRVSTGSKSERTKYFRFSSGIGGQSIEVEWNTADLMSLFPAEVANTLLRRNYATIPNDAAIAWANEVWAVPEVVIEPPAPPPAKQAKKAAPPAPPAPAPAAPVQSDPDLTAPVSDPPSDPQILVMPDLPWKQPE